MLQAAAVFGAGLLARESCGQMPACTVDKTDVGTAFKLSVQVHAATVPSLGEPGHLMKLQPRLGVAFAGVLKETEIADFVSASDPVLFPGRSTLEDSKWEDQAASPTRKTKHRHSGNLFTVSEPTCGVTLPFGMSPASSVDVVSSTPASEKKSGLGCLGDAGRISGPWRFGDTLTFSGHVCDLLAGGLRLRLCAHNDVRLGPWHVELPSPQEFGEATIDLRRRVLPACAPLATTRIIHGSSVHDQIVIDGVGGFSNKLEAGERPPWWETPVLMVPLTHVSDNPHNGVEVAIVARVALSFSINIDPEKLLHEVDYAERSLVDKVDSIVDRFSRWMSMPLGLSCSLGMESLPCSQGTNRAKAADVPSFPKALPSSAKPWPSEIDEPEAEAAPAYTVPAAADWAYKL